MAVVLRNAGLVVESFAGQLGQAANGFAAVGSGVLLWRRFLRLLLQQ